MFSILQQHFMSSRFVPVLAVDATLPEHVEATVRSVEKYSLRLVVKATGHDFLVDPQLLDRYFFGYII